MGQIDADQHYKTINIFVSQKLKPKCFFKKGKHLSSVLNSP